MLLLTGLLTVTLAGCSSSAKSSTSGTPTSSANSGGGPTISLSSLMYMPHALTVRAGTTVTWRNDEAITHTVTSGRVTGVDKTTGLRSGQKPDGLFNKSLKEKGSTFSYTFDEPGTYSYYCDIHFGMDAKVIVTP